MTELVIDVPDNEYLSANDRMSWRPERQRKIALRNRGMFLARKHRLTIPTPCTLTVTGPACRIGETRTPQERLNP